MSGNAIEAIAEAAENAAILLMCYSQKYKISPTCRLGKKDLFVCFCYLRKWRNSSLEISYVMCLLT